MSLALNPQLAEALSDYAEIYRQAYGEEEKPEAFIPAMRERFRNYDSGFKRVRRSLNKPHNDE